MKGWQTAFLLSCVFHLSLFNLPYFQDETPTEKITKRRPIALRLIDRPPLQKKPSTEKIAKPLPPRSKPAKKKEIPTPSFKTVSASFKAVSAEKLAPHAVFPSPKQTKAPENTPAIEEEREAEPRHPKQASTPKMAALQTGKRGFFKDLKITHHPDPAYPLPARREGREGSVQIRIQILENGDLGSIQLYRTSGSNDLDKAALKAIQSWRFEPAMRNGVPVRQSAVFPVVFVLD